MPHGCWEEAMWFRNPCYLHCVRLNKPPLIGIDGLTAIAPPRIGVLKLFASIS
jgi:hypothetical protein